MLIPSVSSCTYHAIVISDHSSVQMDISLPDCHVPQRVWRLDPLMLSDEDFLAYLSTQTDFFLEVNDTPDVAKSIIWESLKAFLRGQIISYTAYQNKKCKQRLQN